MERIDDGKTMEIVKALRRAERYCLNEYSSMAKNAADLIESITTQLAEAKAERDAALSRLKEFDAAERDGRLARLPCKVGDECFEIDPGHGIVKHVVTGTTVYNRAADGKRYMTDFVNVITIDTWATDDHGGEWPDHYTPEEWANRILTRAEAAAAIEKGEGE